MNFTEALGTIVSNRTAMRRPEMVGYVKATPVSREVTATVNATTFGTKVSHVSTTETFTYDGTQWKRSSGSAVTLSDYGIALSGADSASPVSGDQIVATYVYSGESATPAATGTRWLGLDGDVTTFGEAVDHKSLQGYTFKYSDSDWTYAGSPININTYGLTVSGEPLEGDTIVVPYTYTASVFTHTVTSSAVTVTFSEDTFVQAVASEMTSVSSITKTFTYDGTNSVWLCGSTAVALDNYGISTTGTPVANDTISVSYTKSSESFSYGTVTVTTVTCSGPVEVSVDASKFRAKIASSANHSSGYYKFTCDTNTVIPTWKGVGYSATDSTTIPTLTTTVVLSEYGITVAGTPDGSSTKVMIVVTYTEASDAATSSYGQADGVAKMSVAFVRCDVDDSETEASTATYTVSLDTEGSVTGVTGPVISPSTVSTFGIDAYMMTAMLAEDWFETTVVESEAAYTGTGDW